MGHFLSPFFSRWECTDGAQCRRPVNPFESRRSTPTATPARDCMQERSGITGTESSGQRRSLSRTARRPSAFRPRWMVGSRSSPSKILSVANRRAPGQPSTPWQPVRNGRVVSTQRRDDAKGCPPRLRWRAARGAKQSSRREGREASAPSRSSRESEEIPFCRVKSSISTYRLAHNRSLANVSSIVADCHCQESRSLYRLIDVSLLFVSGQASTPDIPQGWVGPRHPFPAKKPSAPGRDARSEASQ
jgi:hypothetical protein